jgi:diamine N-acetyltransferase
MKKNKWNIKLRAVELSDIDLLYTWENDRSIWKVSNTLTPFSRYILEHYIENSYQDIHQAKQVRLLIDAAFEDDDYRTVGAIDLFDYDPLHRRAGVGILIGSPADRSQGIAAAALQALIDYAFNTLQLHQLYCNIIPDNEPSIKLFKNAGFQQTGRKIDWINTPDGFIDEVIFQLINHK